MKFLNIYTLSNKIFWTTNCRALPKNGSPFQKFSKARAEPRPKRGFGNSFQPAIDAPRLEPHQLRHCPKRKDASPNRFALFIYLSNRARYVIHKPCGTTVASTICLVSLSPLFVAFSQLQPYVWFHFLLYSLHFLNEQKVFLHQLASFHQ